MKDTIVESVIEQFKQRSEVGIKKYNTTLDRTDLTRLEWLQHLQEELFDASLYIEKLKGYEWKNVCQFTPINGIDILAKDEKGLIHITQWRESYNIFCCQNKEESSHNWQWKLID